MLPELIKQKANRTLAELPEYNGHIESVHLALWRGGCTLKDITIDHKKGNFALTLKELGFRISWTDLFRRRLVADIRVQSPRFRMLVSKPVKAVKETQAKAKDIKRAVENKTGQSLPDLLAHMIPFRVREFELRDGVVRIQQKGQDLDQKQEKDKEAPKGSAEGKEAEQAQEARMSEVEIHVVNLTNAPKISGSPEAKGHVTAQIMERGRLKMELKINPIAKTPTFDLDVALTGVNLVELNPIFRWQWGVDVSTGTFAMFVEAAAAEGRFKGYVKPFIHELEMHDPEQDKDKSLGKKIKEVVVDAVAGLLKNPKTEKVASRIPFEGAFENPDAGLWEAVVTVLQNAFIKALTPRLDRTINE